MSEMLDERWLGNLVEQGWTDTTAAEYYHQHFAKDNVILIHTATEQQLYIHPKREWHLDGNNVKLKGHFNDFMRSACAPGGELFNQLLEKAVRDAPANPKALAKYNPENEAKSELTKFRMCAEFSARVASAVVILIGLLASAIDERADQPIFDIGPEQHYNLHFKNGVLDVRTKVLRARTREDLVTAWLPYDFMPKDEVDSEAIEFVRSLFEKIHPDPEQRRFALSFLASCMQGTTGDQVMKWNQGQSASNGKSTELLVHYICLSIYTHVLQSNTFSMGNQKSHKQLILLVLKPVRLAFIEEMDKAKIDVEMLKNYVGGGMWRSCTARRKSNTPRPSSSWPLIPRPIFRGTGSPTRAWSAA